MSEPFRLEASPSRRDVLKTLLGAAVGAGAVFLLRSLPAEGATRKSPEKSFSAAETSIELLKTGPAQPEKSLILVGHRGSLPKNLTTIAMNLVPHISPNGKDIVIVADEGVDEAVMGQLPPEYTFYQTGNGSRIDALAAVSAAIKDHEARSLNIQVTAHGGIQRDASDKRDFYFVMSSNEAISANSRITMTDLGSAVAQAVLDRRQQPAASIQLRLFLQVCYSGAATTDGPTTAENYSVADSDSVNEAVAVFKAEMSARESSLHEAIRDTLTEALVETAEIEEILDNISIFATSRVEGTTSAESDHAFGFMSKKIAEGDSLENAAVAYGTENQDPNSDKNTIVIRRGVKQIIFAHQSTRTGPTAQELAAMAGISQEASRPNCKVRIESTTVLGSQTKVVATVANHAESQRRVQLLVNGEQYEVETLLGAHSEDTLAVTFPSTDDRAHGELGVSFFDDNKMTDRLSVSYDSRRTTPEAPWPKEALTPSKANLTFDEIEETSTLIPVSDELRARKNEDFFVEVLLPASRAVYRARINDAGELRIPWGNYDGVQCDVILYNSSGNPLWSSPLTIVSPREGKVVEGSSTRYLEIKSECKGKFLTGFDSKCFHLAGEAQANDTLTLSLGTLSCSSEIFGCTNPADVKFDVSISDSDWKPLGNRTITLGADPVETIIELPRGACNVTVAVGSYISDDSQDPPHEFRGTFYGELPYSIKTTVKKENFSYLPFASTSE